MSTAKVELNGETYTLSALPLRTLAGLWKDVVVVLSLAIATAKAASMVGKEIGLTGGERPDVGSILAAGANGSITDALEDLVSKATSQHIEAILEILWQSVAVRHKALVREEFEQWVTLQTMPGLLKGFFAAQGLTMGESSQGEAGAVAT